MTYLLRDVLPAVGVTAWLTWLAMRIGQRILHRAFSAFSFSSWERQVFGAGLGFGALGFLMLALASAALWYSAVVWSGLITITVLNWRGHEDVQAAIPDADFRTVFRESPLWSALLVVLLIVLAVRSLAPEIFYDALYYHLAVPEQYRMAHRLHAMPQFFYSNFILVIQMVYGAALTVGPAIAPKMLHAVMASLLGLSLIAFGQRFLTRETGILAAVAFLGIPMVLMNASSGGIDVAWCFFHFLSVYALVWMLAEPEKTRYRFAGLLLGLAACGKPTGWSFGIVAPLVVLIQAWRSRWPRAQIVTALANYLIPAAAVISPFLIRGILFHGNPFYPFGGTQWGRPAIDPLQWQVFLNDNGHLPWNAMVAGAGSFFRYLIQPWIQTTQVGPAVLYVGLIYLSGVLLFLWVARRIAALRPLKTYAFVLWGLWLLSTSNPRHGLTTLVLLAPWIAAGMVRLAKNRVARLLIQLLVIGATAQSVLFAITVLKISDGWDVLTGAQSMPTYLSHSHAGYPFPPYPAIAWMNQHLPPHAKILFVGEARRFYLKRQAIAGAFADRQPIVAWSEQAANADELAARLRTEGITHIFFNYLEAIRLESYGGLRWSPRGWQTFEDFWNHHTRLVWISKKETANQEALCIVELLPDRLEQRAQPAFNPFLRWKPR